MGMNTKHNYERKLSPAAQEAIRLRAVTAVRDGMGKSEAARMFGVSRPALYNWLERAAARGKQALQGDRRGRPEGSGAKMKPWQAATTARLIQDKCPDQLKLPFVLWTRTAVALLIERKWGVWLSLSQVGRYLKHWGFTPQKPVRRAYEQDQAAVQRWMDEQYPAVARRAKQKKAEIHWGDEMGLCSDHQAGRSNGRKGKTPVVPGTGQQFRGNMNGGGQDEQEGQDEGRIAFSSGVISAGGGRPTLRFMVFERRFTAPVFIDFLARLIRQAKQKVFLIVDGHPVHRAAKVKRWVQAHQDRIEVFFLPGYSPELNPDELLNQDVKANVLVRRRPQNKAELVKDVRGYLRSTQKMPHVVTNFFQEKHVRYAASM